MTAMLWNQLRLIAKTVWPLCATPRPTSWHRPCRRSARTPKLGVGPVIKDGFYYDFDVETPFTPDDLKEIEKRMQRIIKSSQSFRRRVVTEEEALAEEADQPYKLELIKDKEAHLDPEAATEISGKELSFYDNVDRDGNVVWKDLCRGPHLPNTRYINGVQDRAFRSRILAWQRSQSDAAAHLWCGFRHQRRSQDLSDSS